MNDLIKRFHRYFDILTDNSPAVADAAFRLRYQVYCLETGFEDRDAFTDKRERDAFDEQSAHCVIKHQLSKTDIATVRLVMSQSKTGIPGFPIEERLPSLLADHGIDDRVLPRRSTAEISRFAVSKSMKRRSTDSRNTPAGVGEATNQALIAAQGFNDRRQPLVTFGLFLALLRMSEEQGLTHWIAIMEPPLLRLFSRFGINFVSIGGVVEYHGRRQPCYGNIVEILEGVQKAQPELWQFLTDNGTSRFSALPA